MAETPKPSELTSKDEETSPSQEQKATSGTNGKKRLVSKQSARLMNCLSTLLMTVVGQRPEASPVTSVPSERIVSAESIVTSSSSLLNTTEGKSQVDILDYNNNVLLLASCFFNGHLGVPKVATIKFKSLLTWKIKKSDEGRASANPQILKKSSDSS
jgi:hypothetical protein